MSTQPSALLMRGESFSRRPRYRSVVVAAIVITSVVRVFLITRSFFWQDDYVHIWKAWNLPPADLILQNWNGHIEVGSMSVMWVTARLWPQNWLPPAIYLIAVSIAIPVLYWLAVSRLFGRTKPAVLSLLLVCVWPGLAMPQTWWAAGLELTWLVFFLLALNAVVRHWPRAGLWAAGFILAGYTFSERVAFTAPLVFTALVLAADDSLVSRIRAVWRSRRTDWIIMAAATVVVGILAVYAAAQDEQRRVALSADQWTLGLLRSSIDGVARSVVGWPVTWGEGRGTFPLVPPLWQTVGIVLVVLLVTAIALRSHVQQASVSILMIAPWVLLEPALVLMSRSAFFLESGTGMMMDSRYLIPATTAVLLAIAAWPDGFPKPIPRAVLSIVSVLAVLGGLVGLIRIGPVVDGSASRSWLATARAAFVGEGAPNMANTPSPPFMLGSLFFIRNDAGEEMELGTSRTLLDVSDQRPRINVPTDAPLGPDESGAALPITVLPVKSSTPPGFGGECSVEATDKWLNVPMPQAGLGNPVLSIDVFADKEVDIAVRGRGWEQQLRVANGLRTVWLYPAPGTFDGFGIRVVSGAQSMCVGQARAGSPWAEAP